MDIKKILSQNKHTINRHIDNVFREYRSAYKNIASSAPVAIDKLHSFTKGGKGVRGGLFMISASLFGYTDKKRVLDIAAALEILQASLLIHDDIMDNDFLRRGNPSLFAQFIPVGEKLNASSPEQYGKSMAICIGDIGFFIAMDICHKALEGHTRKSELIQLLHKELIIVGLAQMDDVTFAAGTKMPTVEDILRMYLYKTAHYTFSLPLSLGALMGNMSNETIVKIEQLGEYIGLLFQIKDDQIGLYEPESISGKPLGSDIRENKKTIIRLLLEQKMTQSEREILYALQLKDILTKNDVQIYLELIERYNVLQEIEQLVQKYHQKAESLLSQLDINAEGKAPLLELLSFVIKRSS